MDQSTSPAKNWGEDKELENGNYYCLCVLCKEFFIGHKRRVVCRECSALKNPICCGKETEYFGEALMGSLTCKICDSFLIGIGIEFIKTINDRWLKGERGVDNY